MTNEYQTNVDKKMPSHGVTRACGGVLESVRTLPYTQYVAMVDALVGENWEESQRKNLISAIKLNLINQKEYPFDLLQRKYQLPCTRKIFRKESREYVRLLAGLCGFE